MRTRYLLARTIKRVVRRFNDNAFGYDDEFWPDSSLDTSVQNISADRLTRESRISLNDGHSIPVLGFGVWQIPNGKTCEAAVHSALEAGYRHIDTASIYDNEESVGTALRQSGIARDEVFITTKLFNTEHDRPAEALEASLRRLRLDYVDLYLIHFPVPERNNSWRVLEGLRASGKARSIGVSNFTIRHLTSLLDVSTVVPVVNQVEFHPFLFQKNVLSFCRTKNIVLEAYSPLSHGRKLNNRRVVAIARKYGKSPAQILIRWGLQQGAVVLPKSVNKQRIIENASVFDFHLEAAEMQSLNDLHEKLRTCWDPSGTP